GFDALAVANNHMLDFGEESFFDTLGVLEANAVPYTGAGRNLAGGRGNP
ncbi:MAG: CapA family protein, partial [bacterium]